MDFAPNCDSSGKGKKVKLSQNAHHFTKILRLLLHYIWYNFSFIKIGLKINTKYFYLIFNSFVPLTFKKMVILKDVMMSTINLALWLICPVARGVCAGIPYSMWHTKCLAVITGCNRWCGNNVNNDMMDEPLLVVLLVVCHYISVSYNNLPENGLTRVLSNKYHRGGAPWWRALSG